MVTIDRDTSVRWVAYPFLWGWILFSQTPCRPVHDGLAVSDLYNNTLLTVPTELMSVLAMEVTMCLLPHD